MCGPTRQCEPNHKRGIGYALLLLAWWQFVGCHEDMYNQPRYEPLEPSTFFSDLRSARPLVEGTIPFGTPPLELALTTGRHDGEYVTELPIDVNSALLARGQQRFNIFCSPCHSRTGDGTGMIVQRGYRQPPTYHSDRLRGAPVGHLYDVITNGFGTMPSYASQIPVSDRWAIVGYIRVLQLSRHAELSQLPVDLQTALDPQSEGTTP